MQGGGAGFPRGNPVPRLAFRPGKRKRDSAEISPSGEGEGKAAPTSEKDKGWEGGLGGSKYPPDPPSWGLRRTSPGRSETNGGNPRPLRAGPEAPGGLGWEVDLRGGSLIGPIPLREKSSSPGDPPWLVVPLGLGWGVAAALRLTRKNTRRRVAGTPPCQEKIPCRSPGPPLAGTLAPRPVDHCRPTWDGWIPPLGGWLRGLGNIQGLRRDPPLGWSSGRPPRPQAGGSSDRARKNTPCPMSKPA